MQCFYNVLANAQFHTFNIDLYIYICLLIYYIRTFWVDRGQCCQCLHNQSNEAVMVSDVTMYVACKVSIGIGAKSIQEFSAYMIYLYRFIYTRWSYIFIGI